MWFMPSYGRPSILRDLLQAPGGWPAEVVVLINEDDPERERYFQVLDGLKEREDIAYPWRLCGIAPGSRCADAYRVIAKRWPDEPFYGIVDDDIHPMTPGWHTALEQAAGDRFISLAGGEPHFPLMRNARCMGGELARAMGGICPVEGLKHNYTDCIWDHVAQDFDVLRACPEVIAEHRHWIRKQVPKDITYERGSADIDRDKAVFEQWLHSTERMDMQRRVAKLYGTEVTAVDASSIRLAIAVPIQNEQVDVAYHSSLNRTLAELGKCGFAVNVIEAAGGSHVGKARERVLWDSMRRKPTHVLFIDADMGWDVKAVTRLLCSGHEFAAIAGVKKQEEVKHCVNFLPEQRFHERTKFLEIKDVGFAFVMLTMGAIEKMCAAYPELRYNAGDNIEYGLFVDMIDKTDTSNGPYGERLSEDLSFCRRWRAIGGEIWLDAQTALIHAGRKEYTGRVSDLFEYEKPAILAAE